MDCAGQCRVEALTMRRRSKQDLRSRAHFKQNCY
jgi:hypothetical protein